MLTEAEIQAMRRTFEAAEARPCESPHYVRTIIDGPLSGLRVRIDRWLYQYPGASWGQCIHTQRRVVVAMHVRADQPGVWRFRGYETPGGRESCRGTRSSS